MSAATEQRTEREARGRARFDQLTVREIMRRHVVTASPDYSLRALVEILDREGISGLPVVADDGQVVGVVSTTDVVRFLAENGTTSGEAAGYFELPEGPPWFPDLLPEEPGTALEEHTVAEIMMPARFTVRPETTVSDLARFLLRAGIHRALVFVGQELVGIVTTVDVLRAVAGEEAAG